MSDIAGPPAPKEVQSPVRGTDKTAYVAKDPKNTDARTRDQSQDSSPRDQGEALKARDPAVSISATTAHLASGQEIVEKVSRIDAEGRPIVVTDTLTLALKPNAGLKPNDQIHLKVIDTGKQVTADLLRQNTIDIDPPVRLSVTVVEIRGSAEIVLAQSTPEKAPIEQPYQPPRPQPSATTTMLGSGSAEKDQVALLVAGQPIDTIKIRAAATGALETEKNLQGAATRANSADLATLIQQQATEKPAAAKATAPPSSPPAIAIPFSAAEGPGIGPALEGISISGAPAIIQVLNPAISQVSPAQIATITAVHTLTATEARALPAGTAVLSIGAGVGELARVETNRGDFVLPASDAEGLAGEIVRVAVGNQPVLAGTEAAGEHTATEYKALLVGNGVDTQSERVFISFQTTANTTTSQPETRLVHLDAVQTVAGFLGADGPRADLKLQTAAGTISVTVPSGVKPAAGMLVRIASSATTIPVTTADGVPAASLEPGLEAGTASIAAGAAAGATANAAAQSAQPHAANMLASWPALEEGIAALAGPNVAAAASMISRTAQGGGKLTNALLFFLAAAGRAGPSSWLGSKAEQALAQSNPNMLASLRSDIEQMATLSRETIGDWRPVIIPLEARGSEVPLAALLMGPRPDIDPDAGNNQEDQDPDKSEKAQRFLLQVQFSILGDIQLDGNIRRKTFDLTVRSKMPLPVTLARDAEQIFYRSLEANGFAGAIKFREQDAFPVDAAALIEDHLLGG